MKTSQEERKVALRAPFQVSERVIQDMANAGLTSERIDYMLHPTHGFYRPWIGGISIDGRPPYGITPYISWMAFLPPTGLPSIDGRDLHG